ncbi:MAG: YlbF family regulator [Bacillota bacterium]
MSPYEIAHDLAKSLSKSDEYQEFKKAKSLLEENQESVRLLQDFRRKQLEIQMAQISGEEIDDEYLRQVESLYELLSLNPRINEYLNAEYRLARMMGDIQKIIGEAVNEWFSLEQVNKNVN